MTVNPMVSLGDSRNLSLSPSKQILIVSGTQDINGYGAYVSLHVGKGQATAQVRSFMEDSTLFNS